MIRSQFWCKKKTKKNISIQYTHLNASVTNASVIIEYKMCIAYSQTLTVIRLWYVGLNNDRSWRLCLSTLVPYVLENVLVTYIFLTGHQFEQTLSRGNANEDSIYHTDVARIVSAKECESVDKSCPSLRNLRAISTHFLCTTVVAINPLLEKMPTPRMLRKINIFEVNRSFMYLLFRERMLTFADLLLYSSCDDALFILWRCLRMRSI